MFGVLFVMNLVTAFVLDAAITRMSSVDLWRDSNTSHRNGNQSGASNRRRGGNDGNIVEELLKYEVERARRSREDS